MKKIFVKARLLNNMIIPVQASTIMHSLDTQGAQNS